MGQPMFFPSELGGENSPFLLSAGEWKVFYEYVDIFISSPVSIEDLNQRITEKFGSILGGIWSGVSQMYDIPVELNNIFACMTKLKQDCSLWRDSSHDQILTIAQNIASYANEINQRYGDNIKEIIKEAHAGTISEHTRQRFKEICCILINQSQIFYEQTQPVISSLHAYYLDLKNSEETLKDNFEKLKQDISIVLIETAFIGGPLILYLEDQIIAYLHIPDLEPVITSIGNRLAPIVQKIHGIWDSLADDLQEITDQMEKTSEDHSSFILQLNLDVALKDWASVSDEAQQFIENHQSQKNL